MKTQLAPHRKGQSTPAVFGPCLLWQNGWMDQDTTWYGGLPQLRRVRRHRVRWGPSSPHGKGHSSPPRFGRRLLWPNGRPRQLLLSSCFKLGLAPKFRGGAVVQRVRHLGLRSVGRGFKSCSRQRCVTTLGKLFTPMCLWHQAV